MTPLSRLLSPAQVANLDHNKQGARALLTDALKIYRRLCTEHGNPDVALVFLVETFTANLDIEELAIALGMAIAQAEGDPLAGPA